VENKEEDVFPGSTSEVLAESGRGGAAKALDNQYATIVQATPAAA
jgi:hypothetical protein